MFVLISDLGKANGNLYMNTGELHGVPKELA
jgi:hypothetical protein